MKLLLYIVALVGSLCQTDCLYQVIREDLVYKHDDVYKSYTILELGELNYLTFKVIDCVKEKDSVFFKFTLTSDYVTNHMINNDKSVNFQLSTMDVVQSKVTETLSEGIYKLQEPLFAGRLYDTINLSVSKEKEYNWLFECETHRSLYIKMLNKP